MSFRDEYQARNEEEAEQAIAESLVATAVQNVKGYSDGLVEKTSLVRYDGEEYEVNVYRIEKVKG
jgi:hypothetical protein